MTATSQPSETNLTNLNFLKLFVNLNLNFFKDSTKDPVAQFLEQKIFKILKKIAKLDKIVLSDRLLERMNNHCIKPSILDNYYSVVTILIDVFDFYSHGYSMNDIYQKMTDQLNEQFGDVVVSLKLSEVIELIQEAEDADFKDFLFGETFHLLKKSQQLCEIKKTNATETNDANESNMENESNESNVATEPNASNEPDKQFYEKVKQLRQDLNSELKPTLLNLLNDQRFCDKMNSSFCDWIRYKNHSSLLINWPVDSTIGRAIRFLNQNIIIGLFCDRFPYLPKSKIQSIRCNSDSILINFPDNFLSDVINQSDDTY